MLLKLLHSGCLWCLLPYLSSDKKAAAGFIQTLHDDANDANGRDVFVPVTRLLVLCSSPPLWGAQNKTSKQTNTIFSFPLKVSQTLIDSLLELFHLLSFFVAFLLSPAVPLYQQIFFLSFFFFHDWKLFLVSFYTVEWAHSHKHANNWNAVW